MPPFTPGSLATHAGQQLLTLSRGVAHHESGVVQAAQEIPNGKVLVLSPLEGIEKEVRDTGIGYLDKMEQNISNLKVGLECSI